jgi:(2Fe-2S) ferredoxin
MSIEVWVCQNKSCLAQDSAAVLAAFQEHGTETFQAIGVDCQGQCNMSATVRVMPEEIWYCRVRSGDVPQIIEAHLLGGQPVTALLHPRWHSNN